VAKAAPEALPEHLVEAILAGVSEGRVAHVVAEADRLREVLVQAQRAGDAAGDRGRLERVRHPRAIVVAGGVDEDLRLAFQPPEGLRVQDPVPIALERRAHATLVLVAESPLRLVRAHGERREPDSLKLTRDYLELIGHSTC
jgi:hypothetical protein